MTDDPLLHARVTVPEHVVRRAFAEETIALNLESGQYHGLNATAAMLLDAVTAGEAPDAVARRVGAEAGVPVERVRADLVALLRALAERGLVEVHGAGDA